MYKVKDKWGKTHATTKTYPEAELWVMERVDKECREMAHFPPEWWEYNGYYIVKGNNYEGKDKLQATKRNITA